MCARRALRDLFVRRSRAMCVLLGLGVVCVGEAERCVCRDARVVFSGGAERCVSGGDAERWLLREAQSGGCVVGRGMCVWRGSERCVCPSGSRAMCFGKGEGPPPPQGDVCFGRRTEMGLSYTGRCVHRRAQSDGRVFGERSDVCAVGR